MKTNVRLIVKNGTAERKQKAIDGAFLLEHIINSDEFKNKVIGFCQKNGKKQFSFTSLSNEEVYKKIMEGSEILSPSADFDWYIEIKFYLKRLTKVMGYTNPRISYINCNTKFFDSIPVNSVSGHFAHEYMHKIGFDHKDEKDFDSVPYAIGYIIEQIGRNILSKPKGDTI